MGYLVVFGHGYPIELELKYFETFDVTRWSKIHHSFSLETLGVTEVAKNLESFIIWIFLNT